MVLSINTGRLQSDGGPALPSEIALHSNYPNPFNPSTTLQLDLPQAGVVSLVVYDLLGRELTRLADGRLEAGFHSLI
ncbi:MAG: T9SS type A sorting domain-containing protein, partial [Candidatus Marinimicrobia bacterium]|nr:T9SS type A sorting domain-containing protein [Candidatus Neomarinimicrobiota bacterium]